ncbi:hypothetical protein D3C75_885410 [compost metagenome]
MIEGGLAGATGQAVSLGGVLTILDDIQIEGAHLDGAELHQLLGHAVEVVLVERRHDLGLYRFGTTYGPAIHHYHVGRRHHVGRRIEAVQVGQQEAGGVADATIGVGRALEDLVGDSHLAGVVGARYPQTQDVGAQLVHHVLRADHVADGLGHLAALTIHGEAVSQHLVVRSLVFHGHADHQGGHEPAAVLVRAFQIHVGRVAVELGTGINH